MDISYASILCYFATEVKVSFNFGTFYSSKVQNLGFEAFDRNRELSYICL